MTEAEQLRDHEMRIRGLEAQRVTDARLQSLESDVGGLKVTVARLAVIYGAISALGSAGGSALAAWLLRGAH